MVLLSYAEAVNRELYFYFPDLHADELFKDQLAVAPIWVRFLPTNVADSAGQASNRGPW